MDFEVFTKNIKLSVQCQNAAPILRKIRSFLNSKNYVKGEFFIVRLRFTYTLFDGGHINVTGLKNFDEIEPAFEEIRQLLRISGPCDFKHHIDNICSTGKTPFSTILLRPLTQAIQLHLEDWCMFRPFVIKADYQPDKFPSLHIKTKIGSILLFGSGNFILVGYKKRADAQHLSSVLKHFLGYADEDDHCRLTDGKRLPTLFPG